MFHLTPTLFDLMPLAQAASQGLQSSAHPIAVTGPEELCVAADANRLRQALENVLTNALKHTPAGGAVAVDCACEERADGWWAVIRVQDHGPGIPAHHLETLTERFVTHGAQGGLGLGLHLVHGILTAHEGTVTIESVEGQGTTVTLALPGAEPRAPACAS